MNEINEHVKQMQRELYIYIVICMYLSWFQLDPIIDQSLMLIKRDLITDEIRHHENDICSSIRCIIKALDIKNYKWKRQ